MENLPAKLEDVQLNEDDFEGYTESRPPLKFVSIRQKDVKEGKKLVRSAGDFDMTTKADRDAPDQDGEEGLRLTILTDRVSRTYWPEGEERPLCRSFDGFVGRGTPGGNCATCPLSQWGEDNQKPKCKEGRNLVVWDWKREEGYILQLSTSAIKVYREFLQSLPSTQTGRPAPPIAFKVLVTTEHINGKGMSYYIPKFEPTDINQGEDLEAMRKLKREAQMFEKQMREEQEPEQQTDRTTEDWECTQEEADRIDTEIKKLMGEVETKEVTVPNHLLKAVNVWLRSLRPNRIVGEQVLKDLQEFLAKNTETSNEEGLPF